MTQLYEIKLLDDSHSEAANKIFQNVKKVMRTPMTRDYSVVLTTDNRKTIGAFLDNELVAFVQETVWPSLPVYSVGNLNIKKGLLERYDFSNSSHPFIPIIDYIVSRRESNRYYTWYYNRSLGKAYHRLQLQGNDLLNNCQIGFDKHKQDYRYDRYIEEIVEPGEVAKFKAHELMQGGNIYDIGFMVVKCCLKPEYRKIPNYFERSTIEKCLKTIPKIKNI